MESQFSIDDRVILPTMSGERHGKVVNVAYDNEIKVVFDDDRDDTGMWFPPTAVLKED